jgi:5-methylcytosine-specific restriction protein A
MVNASDFRAELNRLFREAGAEGLPYVDVTAGELHRRVGGYPGTNHRMPTCCNVMQQEMRPGDRLLHAPPKGRGASVEIRYSLPRSWVPRF